MEDEMDARDVIARHLCELWHLEADPALSDDNVEFLVEQAFGDWLEDADHILGALSAGGYAVVATTTTDQQREVRDGQD